MIRIRVVQLAQRLRVVQIRPLLDSVVSGCRELSYSHRFLSTYQAPTVPLYRVSDDASVEFTIETKQNHGEVVVEGVGIIRGSLKDGKLEGECISESNGKTYIGEYKAGVLSNGSGITKQENGYYIGKVVDGLKGGYGIWKQNETLYEGNFLDNVPHGIGKLTRADQTVLRGYFDDGKLNWEGTLTTPQGAVFKGPWIEDVEHGLGTVTLNQLTFDVAIFDGAIEVFTLRSDAPKTYTLLQKMPFVEGLLQGTLVNGEADGWCVFTTFEGTRLIGEYHKGKLLNGCGRWSKGSEVYVGAMSEGKRHGYGVWSNTATGESYTGYFDQDQHHGEGRLVYRDGSVSEGTFQHSLLHGSGKHTDAISGISYQGMWKNDAFHGEGTLSDAKGASFSAYFMDGVLMMGRGELTLPSGREVTELLREITRCTFVLPARVLQVSGDAAAAPLHVFSQEDKIIESVEAKDPKRKMLTTKTTYVSGIIHFGPVHDGLPHGLGRTVFPTGEEYEGDYVHGVRHGQGFESTPRGKYEGDWHNNQKEGEGQFVYADGKVYKGLFQKNEPHGTGSLTYNKSMWKIDGEFQNGQIVNGHGQFTYIDRVFFAEYAEGDLIRSGMYIRHDVFVKLKPGQVTAERKKGRLQGARATAYEKWYNQRSPVKHIQGVEINQDGSIYEGEWLRHMKHGVGRMFFPDGRRLKGIWDLDKMIKKISVL